MLCATRPLDGRRTPPRPCQGLPPADRVMRSSHAQKGRPRPHKAIWAAGLRGRCPSNVQAGSRERCPITCAMLGRLKNSTVQIRLPVLQNNQSSLAETPRKCTSSSSTPWAFSRAGLIPRDPPRTANLPAGPLLIILPRRPTSESSSPDVSTQSRRDPRFPPSGPETFPPPPH